jgi:hypothetical protein
VARKQLDGSFRDPSGHIIINNGILRRVVLPSYEPVYRKVQKSGLYKELIKLHLLIPHIELHRTNATSLLTIQPDNIPFISYPYEWCFGELKDAALLTLKIQHIALEYGFALKDASAYNIQFHKGKPVFIDTLSFEPYIDGSPWVAYRQFCMHFLLPLLLVSKKYIDLNKLFIIFLDGIPLKLGSTLLPKITFFNPSLLIHIHIHALLEQRFSKNSASLRKNILSKEAVIMLLKNLETTIRRINTPDSHSQWSSYTTTHTYGADGFAQKKNIVSSWLPSIKVTTALDIGANTGTFTKMCTASGIDTIAIDNDQQCIETLYGITKQNNEARCLALCIDITNPSPAIGWENLERSSFVSRTHVDLVLALALLHHITIGNNIPFHYSARLLHRLGKYLIIEFIPKTDPMVQKLLANRADTFEHYSRKLFEKEFAAYFSILRQEPIAHTGRLIYLMERKNT